MVPADRNSPIDLGRLSLSPRFLRVDCEHLFQYPATHCQTHLAGVVAAHTTLPVIGLPVPTPDLGGLDSLLSTVQMPGDVPVASMAVGMGGPRNSGLFAVQILATADAELRAKLVEFKEKLTEKIAAKDASLRESIS